MLVSHDAAHLYFEDSSRTNVITRGTTLVSCSGQFFGIFEINFFCSVVAI